jgi:GntR family transcriptional regulator
MAYLRIDPSSGVPLGLQIAQGLRLAIAQGRLLPGEQLPSARDLATELRVNFHTVRKAFGDLQTEGVLEFRRGIGTFVKEHRRARAAALRGLIRARLGALVEDTAGLGADADQVAELIIEELERILPGRRSRR